MRNTILFFALLLSGCGVNSTTSSSKTATATATTTTSALYVTEFSPSSGTLTAAPTSVVVKFSTSTVNYGQASLASNYTLNCAGNVISGSSVSFSYGGYYATVSFASQTVANGSTCYFSVSGNIYDDNGSSLGGTTEQAYYISSSGSSSFSWSYTSSTAYTSAAGGSGGTAFQQVGADGLALSGLNLRVGTYVEGLKGVWMNGSGSVSYGSVFGSSPVTTELACPSGERVTGIYGYYGTYVNAVGITCKNSGQTVSHQSGVSGASSGSYFELNCPSGRFATALYGRSGGLLDQIGIGCR